MSHHALNDDDAPKVYLDADEDDDPFGFMYELPTRVLDPRSTYRIVWVLPVLPAPRDMYARALRTAWDARHDPRGLIVATWLNRALVVAVTVRKRSLAGAAAAGERIFFDLVAEAHQEAPAAAAMFISQSGVRFYQLDRWS
jgi:hypothetical protein